MKQRIIRPVLIWIIILTHFTVLSGCGSTNHVTLTGTDMPAGSKLKIASVVVKDGRIIEFDSDGGLCVEKTSEGKTVRAIVGKTHGTTFEIETDNVLEVRVDQKESSGAGNFIGGFLVGIPTGAGLLVLIVLLTYGGR